MVEIVKVQTYLICKIGGNDKCNINETVHSVKKKAAWNKGINKTTTRNTQVNLVESDKGSSGNQKKMVRGVWLWERHILQWIWWW